MGEAREERLDRLPIGQYADIVRIVMAEDTLEGAVECIIIFDDTRIGVAIIDNLEQLHAAFVLSYLRLTAQRGSARAKKLVALADELHIRGSLGLIYARDKVFRETGYFAGT